MALEVHNVSHRYGAITALSEISFSVGPGVTALLGVNGAGKSTLLSVCAGVMAPSAGSVHVSSHDLYQRGSRRQALGRVAFMPQFTTFPGTLTVRDVVVYLGWLKGMSGATLRRRADECLDAVGLTTVRDRKCKTLSGGMQRRVALAQALVPKPDVLLLDEPSTGLDPAQRRNMVDLIRDLPGVVVMSSHVVEDAEDLADRVVIIHGSRVVFNDCMAELRKGGAEVGTRSLVEAAFLRVIRTSESRS